MTGVDGKHPVLLLVSKHLYHIPTEAQREAIFVWAISEDRSPESLYSGPVLSHKPEMVAEKRQDADEEHGRHKKQKQHVEFGVSVGQLILEREERGEPLVMSYFSTEPYSSNVNLLHRHTGCAQTHRISQL